MSDGSVLENRVRRIVGARLQRGDRTACAAAAGHKGPWATKWLSGDLSATVDELAALAAFVGLSLGKILSAPDASPIDWEVFDLMGLLETEEQKQDARTLVAGLADDAVLIIERRPSASTAPRPHRKAVKRHRTG